jgi:hypothetical protein
MMRSKLAILAFSCLLAGCVTQPANYATTLSMQDPKFESEDCKQIRVAALGYDDKVGQRAMIGMASGLILGPFGIPLAAAADANQNEQRRLFAREIHLRCSSLPLPPELMESPPKSNIVHDGQGRMDR